MSAEKTDDVPEVLEDLPDLETIPPRQVPNIFECARGHRQIGSHADFLTNRRPGFPDINSGAQCIQCKLEWFGEVFPTRDTGVQYVPEPRKGD